MVYESVRFDSDKHLTAKDLAVNRNDIKNAMILQSENDIDYWQNRILSLVNRGILKNTKEALIYYMIGVSNGWIRP